MSTSPTSGECEPSLRFRNRKSSSAGRSRNSVRGNTRSTNSFLLAGRGVVEALRLESLCRKGFISSQGSEPGVSQLSFSSAMRAVTSLNKVPTFLSCLIARSGALGALTVSSLLESLRRSFWFDLVGRFETSQEPWRMGKRRALLSSMLSAPC